MGDWWKAPVLQGPENDYGEYDYMIEFVPKDYAKWELTKEKWKCEGCGKYSHLLFCSCHYFHTLDGYDCMDYQECWKCRLKEKVLSVKYNFKKKVGIIKLTFDLCRTSKEKYTLKNLKKYYDIARKVYR